MRVQTGKNKIRILEYFNRLIRDHQGTPLYILGAARDVTRTYHSIETIKGIIDGSSEGIIFYDKNNLRILYLNEAVAKILKYSKKELLGCNICSFFSAEYQQLFEYGIIKKTLGEIEGIELPIIGKENKPILVSLRGAEIPLEGQMTPVIYINDLTEQKAVENELRLKTIALENTVAHDPLTGLYSRFFILNYLTLALNNLARRAGNEKLTLLNVDINDLKAINDRIGHNMADKVLIAFAETIQKTIRKTDYAGRMGGDELLVVLDNDKDTEVIINKIISALQNVYIPGIGTVCMTTSIGSASLQTKDLINKELKNDKNFQNELELFLQQADTAMYDAKEHARKLVKKNFFVESDLPESLPLYIKPSEYNFYKTGDILKKDRKQSEPLEQGQRSKVIVSSTADPKAD